jgi:hypothetical protein
MKRSTRQKTTLLGAFLNGVALPAEVETRHRFRSVSGSDIERLRGDVHRVGRLLGSVMKHEHEKASSAHSA